MRLGFLPGGTRVLLQSRILSPAAIDTFLAHGGGDGGSPRGLRVDRDNLRLEYSTPRGNVRDYDDSLEANETMFQAFAPASALAGTHLAPGAP